MSEASRALIHVPVGSRRRRCRVADVVSCAEKCVPQKKMSFVTRASAENIVYFYAGA